MADAPIVVSLSFSAIVSKLWPSKGDPWPKVPGWTLGPCDGLLPAELVDGGPAMTRAIEHQSAHESTAPNQSPQERAREWRTASCSPGRTWAPEIRLSLDRRLDLVHLENLTRFCARSSPLWDLKMVLTCGLTLILFAAARTSLSATVAPEKGARVGTLRCRIIPSNRLQGSHASARSCTPF